MILPEWIYYFEKKIYLNILLCVFEVWFIMLKGMELGAWNSYQ